jgi:hypothetical protein
MRWFFGTPSNSSSFVCTWDGKATAMSLIAILEDEGEACTSHNPRL